MSARDLWCAVIDRAIRDARGLTDGGESPALAKLNQTSARLWLDGRKAGFTEVCDLAEVDPEGVRRLATSGPGPGPGWRAAGRTRPGLAGGRAQGNMLPAATRKET